MTSLWTKLRPKRTTDIGQQWLDMFKYNGHSYPLGGYGRPRDGNTEPIENDFVGYVNGAYKASGVVFACMLARMMVFTEMRFNYQQFNDGRPGDLKYHKDLRILENPWPNGNTGELLARAIQDADLCGNNFIVRKDGPQGPRLRRLRPDWTYIQLDGNPAERWDVNVKGYVYKPENNQDPKSWEAFPIDGSNGAVAHWSPIPDPEAMYRGMSPLTPVVREVMADKSATRHKQAFFDNAATPNIAVAFKETVSPEEFEEFMEKMNTTKHGVEHAYETMYLAGGADVSVIGADMKQLDFKQTQGAGETRIAAALRVHPVIVGLSEGMQGSTLNEGNFKSAKQSFSNQTMRPLWRSLCGAYSVLVPPRQGARLWYDDRDVAFLQEDRKELAEMQQIQATTIKTLSDAGFEPETAIDSVIQDDWRLLKHTGLFSVQLQPPGTTAEPAADPAAAPADNPDDGGDTPPPDDNSGDNAPDAQKGAKK